jgi:hypothetical protein
MTPAQRHAYVEAHMTVQQHIAQANLHFQQPSHRQVIKENDQQSSSTSSTSTHHQYTSNIKIPQIISSSVNASSYASVPDDGLQALGYDNGLRVLQSIGSWSDIPPNIPRPNLIPFTEPYVEGGSLNPNTRLTHHIKTSHSHTTSSTGSRKSRSSNHHSANVNSAPKAFEVKNVIKYFDKNK